jgi:hypothetical protein
MSTNVTIHPGPPITVSPDPAPVKKNGVDQVVWHCATNCSFDVDFHGQSPFPGSHFDQGNNQSQPVRQNANPGSYKYTVKVGSDTLDPQIIVN